MQFLQQFSSSLACRWVLPLLVALSFSAAIAQQTLPQTPTIAPAPGTVKPAAITATGDAILGRSPGGVFVSMTDVLSELRRAPEADRQAILAKSEQVQQIVSNLLVRRLLAAEAERDLVTDQVLSATLAIARDRILSDAFLARMDAQNSPSDAVLDAYARNVYQANAARFEMPVQTRARHILLCKCGADSLQKAKDILAQLRAGASFEDLAKAHSTDEGSAAKGGDLGFFGAGKMVKPFEDALNKLGKPGELSEPVESQFGYHIIRLEERREKSLLAYADVREKLVGEARKSLLGEKRMQKVQALSKDFVFENDALEAKPTAR